MNKKTEKKDSNETNPSKINDENLKKNEEEFAKLRKDKLLLLAEMENKRKDFQRQLEYVRKYGSKPLIDRVLNFLVDLEERALQAMQNDLADNAKSKEKSSELINK